MDTPAWFEEDGVPAGADGGAGARGGATPGPGAVAAVVDGVTAEHGRAPDRLIEILHEVQHVMGYVPGEAVPEIARRLNLSRADVHGVLTFYDDFRQSPPPRHVLRLCGAEACQSTGAAALFAHLADAHGVRPGERTACEGFGLETVYCLGNCALGPAGELDGAPLARLTPERIDAIVAAAVGEEEDRR